MPAVMLRSPGVIRGAIRERISSRPLLIPRSALNAAYINALYVMIGLKLLVSPLLFEMPFENPWRYNFMQDPGGLSILPKILDASIILCGMLGIMMARSRRRYLSFITLSILNVTFGLIFQAYAERPIIDAFYNLAKFLGPLIILKSLEASNCQESLLVRNNKALSVFIIALILMGLLLMAPSHNRGREWLPAYFGGLHTSSYVSLMALALVFQSMNRPIYRSVWMPASLFLVYMIIWGWGIRSAAVGKAAAGGYLWVMRKKDFWLQ